MEIEMIEGELILGAIACVSFYMAHVKDDPMLVLAGLAAIGFLFIGRRFVKNNRRNDVKKD